MIIKKITIFTLLFSSITFFYVALFYLVTPVAKLSNHFPHRQVNNPFKLSLKSFPPDNWTSLKKIPKLFQRIIIFSEDGKFYQHSGFDFYELKEAIKKFLTNGRSLRGASTISQQVVKNIFLSHRRSYIRKFHEIILTYKMERHLSKKRILEIYLNIAEFGPDKFGIKEGARHFFTKSPLKLTVHEMAFLVSILPYPKNYQHYKNLTKRKIERLLRHLRWRHL